MALPSRPVHIPAGLLIDEGTRPELLDVGAANVSNVNVRRVRRGVLGKRLGYGSLTNARLDATTRTAGYRMFCHRDVLSVIDGAHLDAYSTAAAKNVTRSRVPDCSASRRAVATYAGQISPAVLQDIVVCGSYAAYAYAVRENDPIAAQQDLVLYVEDVSTGIAVRTPEVVFTTNSGGFGDAVCCLARYSTYLFAIYYDSSVGVMGARYLDTASAASISAGWIAVPGSGGSLGTHANPTDGALALSTQSLTDRVAFAFVNDSGGASQVTVTTLNTSGLVQTATINTSSTTPDRVAVEGSSSDTLWVAWNEGTAVKMKGLDPTTLSTVKASTATMLTLSSAVNVSAIGIVSSSTPGAGRIVANDGAQDRLQMRNFVTTAGAATTSGSQITVPNAMIGCRPFRVGSRYYALFAPSPLSVTNNQRAAVLCDFTDNNEWLRPIANLAPSLAAFPGQGAPGEVGNLYCHVEPIGGYRYATGLSVVTSGAASTTNLVTFDFGDRARWRAVGHNGDSVLSGGLLASSDGVRVAELGFVVRPPRPLTSSSGTGITGSYRYVVAYEQVDANGNWAVSSISDPSLPLTVSNKTVSVVVRPCSITARQMRTSGADVRVTIYRTSAIGEAPYYRLTTLPNDLSVASYTYADTTVDATLTANAELYSPSLPGSGSAQDRRAPPHCQDVESYNGMLVVASGSTLWWSGQAVDGEQTWFNPAFVVPVEGDGDITAIRALDGTLYVFKRRGIWAVAGDAPSDNGAQGGLGVPRRIATDVGCIEPASCLVTSAGIFFQSQRGLEILSRNGSVSWIGESVRQTLASFPVVSSAVLDDVEGLAIFSLSADEQSGLVGATGRDLVFDLTAGGWIGKDDKRGSSAHQPSQDAAMITVGGTRRYGWLATDGTVYYRKLSSDSDKCLDGTHFVVAEYELPPWKQGLQQEQRVYEVEALFERASAAGLEVDIAYDYESYTDTKAWTEADIATERQVSFRPTPQTTAFQLRVKDVAPAVNGTGEGLVFLGLSADIAPKQGPTRGTTRLNPELRR